MEWQKFSEPRLGDNVDDEEDILDEYQYDSAEDVEDPDYDELKIAEVEVDEKEDKAKKVWWDAGVVKCEMKGKKGQEWEIGFSVTILRDCCGEMFPWNMMKKKNQLTTLVSRCVFAFLKASNHAFLGSIKKADFSKKHCTIRSKHRFSISTS